MGGVSSGQRRLPRRLRVAAGRRDGVRRWRRGSRRSAASAGGGATAGRVPAQGLEAAEHKRVYGAIVGVRRGEVDLEELIQADLVEEVRGLVLSGTVGVNVK